MLPGSCCDWQVGLICDAMLCLAWWPADAPSALQDVLYTLLVVVLGVTAYSERKALR
jgi:hypothetical protein